MAFEYLSDRVLCGVEVRSGPAQINASFNSSQLAMDANFVISIYRKKNLIWVRFILNGNSNVYRVYFYFLVSNVLDKFTITIP